jgi:hypothetical protein
MDGLNQILPLSGSMNQDNDPIYIRSSDGEVFERINLRVNSKDGRANVNEKIIGNTLININKWDLGTPLTLPDGENKVIGWCNDYTNNAILYFVYNSNDDHSIFRYFQSEKNIEKVWFAQPGLGFEDTFLEPVVVDGIAYWVNGEQQPKSFVIDKAVNYTNTISTGDGTAYTTDDVTNLAEQILPLIKRPPQFAPSCIYMSEKDYNFNNLRKKQFQFKYCYQYRDKQRSAWSPISKIPLPNNELTALGIWEEDISINNRIDITINTGAHYVEKILVAARESGLNNTGDFFLFEEINKDEESLLDDVDHTVEFFNNKRTESINTDINNRYCDDVPLSGNDIEHFDNKYIGIAYPKKGYDPVVTDYELTAIENVVDLTTPTVYMQTGLSYYIADGFKQHWVDIPTTFYPNTTYTISFQNVSTGLTYSYSKAVGAVYGGYPSTLAVSFINTINADVPGLAQFTATPSANRIRFHVHHDSITNLIGRVVLQPNTSLMSYKCFKRGQFHPFGIIYNDEFGRYNVVYGDKEIFSPLISSFNDIEQYVSVGWEINHIPPDWATTYRWCYIKNKTYTYFLYVPKVYVYGSTDGEITLPDVDTFTNNIPSGKYFLDINTAITAIRDAYPNAIIENYIWQNGDRVRVIGSDISYEILKEWTLISTTPDSDVTLTGFLVDVDIWDVDHYVRILEIYRPNPEPQETVFYEFGDEYEIIDAKTANRRHAGQIQHQDGALPATGIFDFGDVYFRYRFLADGTAVPVEDANYSDYYISNSIDIGRAGAKIDSEQKYLNQVVRSENYLENTEYNLLNVFMPNADYFSASEMWGKIIGICEVGDVLKIIQEHKETSVYVGKTIAKQADGTDIFLDSSNVFGTVNKYIEARGSKYIRSIVKNNRYLYYFDDTTGEFVRSSANGQMAISSYYKMKNWFEKKSKELRESTESYKDVIVSCDNDYNEVLVSFIIGTDIETIVFSEEEGNAGWKYFITLKSETSNPENFAFLGDTLVSFLGGNLYLHNEGSPNTFYETLHPCSITAIINQFGSNTKRFSSIHLSCSKNIFNFEFDIPEGLNYPQQKSILVPTIIREKENALYSDILRNIIGRDGVENTSLLYNGTRLVGEQMSVTLSDVTDEDIRLGLLQVNFLIAR